MKLGPLIAAAGLLMLTANAHAHHPGADLDKVMGDRETYFQIIDDRNAPGFELADADGRTVRLADFSDKIVILNFVYAGCPDVCPLHAEKLAGIQDMLAQSPMRDRVQFVSITTDPANDNAAVLKEYGPAHGLAAANWTFLTVKAGDPEDLTRRLAKAYGLEFTAAADGMQMHGIVTHVIDYGGRFAAKFHGLKFKSSNLVLYINGLINNRFDAKENQPDGWWDKVRSLF